MHITKTNKGLRISANRYVVSRKYLQLSKKFVISLTHPKISIGAIYIDTDSIM